MKTEQSLVDFIISILEAAQISVRFPESETADISTLDGGLRAKILGTENEQEFFAKKLSDLDKRTLYFVTDVFHCDYTILWLPEKEQYMVCGPMLFEEIKYERFLKLFEEMKFPNDQKDALQDYYLKLPYIGGKFPYEAAFLRLADNLYGKGRYEIVYDNELLSDEWYLNYLNYYRIPEEPFHGIKKIEERYALENALTDTVQNADLSKALEISNKFSAYFPNARMANTLRDIKDYLITLNTLLRKATETAGVHPIYIDALSNRNVQKIEEMTGKEEAPEFITQTIKEYCQLVRKHTLVEHSPLIQKAILYINTDLQADLTLNTLAEQLSVNASYLSSLFKKEMRLTLTEYVNNCRISHARKLLLTTELPLKNVAAACGITDIYYFNKLFKKITGMTPKAYSGMDKQNRKKELALLAKNPAVMPERIK